MTRMRKLGVSAIAALAVLLPSTVGPATATDAWSAGTPVLAGAYTDPWVLVTPEGVVRLYYVDAATSVGYASTSFDQGATWPKASSIPVFAGALNPIIVSAYRVSPLENFCDPNNGYRAYYASRSDGSIKMAIGADAMGFDTCSQGGLPVSADTAGSEAFANPAVIQLQDGTWLMAYVGYKKATPNTKSIYFATSERGLQWTWKGLAVADADAPMLVIWDDGSVRMYFHDAKGIEHVKYASGAFGAASELDLANTAATDPMVVKYAAKWHMFYTVLSGATSTGIFSASGPAATGTAPSPTVSATKVPTAAASTPAASPTATATASASPAATATPSASASASPTPTASATPTPTPTASTTTPLYFVKCKSGDTFLYKTGTDPKCPAGYTQVWRGAVKA